MRITLRQLSDMLRYLPQEVLDKKLGYLDLSHMQENDLEDLKTRLINSEDEFIEECQN
jgi:hypothetical protein